MLPKISQIMFNVMGKNFSAKMNEDIRLASKKEKLPNRQVWKAKLPSCNQTQLNRIFYIWIDVLSDVVPFLRSYSIKKNTI